MPTAFDRRMRRALAPRSLVTEAALIPRLARGTQQMCKSEVNCWRDRIFPATMLLAIALAATATARADEVVPANAQVRWWKGNLHTHTFWSDGDDFPEMVAEWYRTHGYHFLALTDHNVLAQGIKWRDEPGLIKKAGDKTGVEKYLKRFGPAWVEIRGEGEKREVRLKPLDEFRALVEERGKFLMIPAEEISDKAEGGPLHMNASN